MKMIQKERWIGISVVNLSIVALLGLLLRIKMLFYLPGIDFKYILHAHSHFAFAGWISLALLSLMVYEILPAASASRSIYRGIFIALLLNAVGMLLSFPFQGYGFFSILFSTLFIFSTYAFAAVFIPDLLRSQVNSIVKALCISSLLYLVLSSVGPFTLAYLLVIKSSDALLYKDSIYTYLHLQYSGFFSLAVFAILFSALKKYTREVTAFSWLLILSVIPSLCISYLWHPASTIVKFLAVIGSASLLICAVLFFRMLGSLRISELGLSPIVKRLALLAMTAFFLKLIFQAATIIPSLGDLVFSNRPVIIGFLHLVLLGFVSIYLLAHFIHHRLIQLSALSRVAIWLFIGGIVLNELTLFTQGLFTMLLIGSSLYPWLLLLSASCLASGSLLLVFSHFSGRMPGVFNKGHYFHQRISVPNLNDKI
jgi:hypothetical protein